MTLDKKTVFRAFFFGVFIFLIWQLLRLLSPFFTALLVAVTLTLIFYPIHSFLKRRLPGRENLTAGLSTAIILLMVILPVSLFIWILIQQSSNLSPVAMEKLRAWRETPTLETLLPASVARAAHKLQAAFAGFNVNLQDIVMKNVDELGVRLSGMGTRIVKNVFLVIFDIFVTGFSLFFLFRDGEKIVRRIMDLVPMETFHKENILARLNQTLSAVVRGVFVTAAVQGFLAGLGYAACGSRFAILLGFATAFTAPIPFVGAPAVWLPVSLYLVGTGSHVKGFLLMGWGLLVVSSVDNILRPILIGEKAKLPIFLLFFGMLGGLQMYGPVGLLTGPLLIACAMSFAKIFREQMAQLSPRPGKPPDAQPIP